MTLLDTKNTKNVYLYLWKGQWPLSLLQHFPSQSWTRGLESLPEQTGPASKSVDYPQPNMGV